MTQQELELPKGWVETKLGDIIASVKGKKPKTLGEKNLKNKIPYITIKAFEKRIFEQFTNDDSCPKCTENNLLMVWDGSRSGLVGFGVSGVIGSTLVRLDCYENNSKFLWYFLQSKYQILNSKPRGTGTPHVDPTILWNFKFLLPPLNEQKRIVSKIEELFSKIDSTKQSLEHAKLQLVLYRHSLIKSAFEGKLTEKWREQNNIEQDYGNDVLGNLILFSKNGFTGKPNDLKKGVPRLGIETITQSDSIYVDETMHKFIEIPTSKIDVYRAKKGDLFVCRQNGNQNYVGKCAIFKEIISPMIFSDSLIQFRVNTELILPVYLAFFINSHSGRKQIEAFCSTTAGNFSINGTNLKKTIIVYPSIPEQDEIVSQLEQGFSLIENSQRIVNSTLQTLETMRMSVLKQAFQGKLVPQDPNDEPASILLEKIKKAQVDLRSNQRRTKNVK